MIDIPALTAALKAGQVVIMPTDTVYGLAASAHDKQATAKLYELKDRSAEQKPGTIIAANTRQLEDLGLKHRYLEAVKQFWPGAVSVVIPCANPELAYLHLGKNSLAVRVPDDPRLLNILEITGPLITSSANLPGQPPATNLQKAQAYFGSQVTYFDGGELGERLPSTVIRTIDGAIEVLRPGAVDISS